MTDFHHSRLFSVRDESEHVLLLASITDNSNELLFELLSMCHQGREKIYLP